MGQRHLARTGRLSAADHGDLRGEMVRSPERPPGHQPARQPRAACHGVNFGGLQRLLARQRRQDGRQAPCEHRLARARGTDHNDVVAARRGNLQRPFHMRLPLHVGEILGVTRCRRFERFAFGGLRRNDLRVAVQAGDDLRERRDADRVDSLHDRRFSGVPGRQHQPPQPLRTRPDRQGQHAPHGFDRAVERQFADEHRVGYRFGVDTAHRRENPHGNRQVEARALFAQVGGRQVDDDFLARHPLARVLERRPDALFALLHGIVGQPYEVQAQTAARDVDLDGHRHGVDPHEGACIRADEHG